MEFITTYSNLILVIITGIYAYLTWRMVREMRVARENQSDANLIAIPVLVHQIYSEIQLVNAGPALDVELSISLDPLLQTTEKTWRHPAFLVGQKENFLLPMGDPSKLDSLHELANKHNNVVVNIKWKNIFRKSKSYSASYNLNDLMQGWYNAGHLIPPNDVPTQMKELTTTLEKIHRDLEKVTQEVKRLNTNPQKENSKPKSSSARKSRSK